MIKVEFMNQGGGGLISSAKTSYFIKLSKIKIVFPQLLLIQKIISKAN